MWKIRKYLLPIENLCSIMSMADYLHFKIELFQKKMEEQFTLAASTAERKGA